MSSLDLNALIDEVCEIAQAAAGTINAFRDRGVSVRSKADMSPVTDADEAANALIISRLENLTPEIPVVAEESVAHGYVPDISGGVFWLVDPLDGTKEFLKDAGEFTVNIGLIQHGRPILGAVQLPARDLIYFGWQGHGAFERYSDREVRPIMARKTPEAGATVVASRSHFTAETEAWLKDQKVADTHHAGSSYKFCVIAAGEADLYPRLGRTMEWDTAAAHAILRVAGGSVRTLDGDELTYGKPGFENPFFVARGAE